MSSLYKDVKMDITEMIEKIIDKIQSHDDLKKQFENDFYYVIINNDFY